MNNPAHHYGCRIECGMTCEGWMPPCEIFSITRGDMTVHGFELFYLFPGGNLGFRTLMNFIQVKWIIKGIDVVTWC